MKRLPLWAFDHPVFVGALIAILTIVFALQIPRLQIDTSAEGLMAEKDPARQYYDQARQRFGSISLTVIVVKADDVFTPQVLGVIQRITAGLERLDGVARVESLTTVKNIKWRGNVLDLNPLVRVPVPSAHFELQRIRADALGNRLFVGSIVSKDGKAAAVNITTDAEPGDTGFSQRFSDQVEALIKKESAPGLTIYQIGNPLTKVTFGDYIRQDQRSLIPLSFPVLLTILLLAFRRVQSVVIPIVTGGISVVWALGLMAFFGLPVNVLTAVIPWLMIAIGFTDDVHMLSEYYHLLAQGEAKLSAIKTMIKNEALPITVTMATTVLGFGSLITTDITMLVQFGYASAMGLTANFIVTLVVVPIILKVWPVAKGFSAVTLEDESGHGVIPRMMERLCEFNLRHRVPIMAVSAFLVASSVVGWFFLRVNTDFHSFFPERSFIRQRIQDLHTSVAGAEAFYLVVETGREDGVKDPDLLRKIAKLQEFLASSGQIDKSISIADFLMKLNRELHGGDPAFEVIPDTREEVAQSLLALEGKDVARYLDFANSSANIVVRENITSSWELSAFLGRLDAYIAKTFPPTVKVRPTGEAILIRDAADYMAVNEITSFSYTFIIIFLIHAWLFRSLLAGLLSLIPNVIPILFNFGLMGFLGIPLNVGTAMIATIAIGITVDDTVYCMVTYSRQLDLHRDKKIAVLNTMKIQGRPIIYISLALAGGFLVLAFSNFVPTVHFGILSAMVMLIAMVTELVLTPILMYSAPTGLIQRRRAASHDEPRTGPPMSGSIVR